MFRTLMTSRRFAPLFWCQFFSAFNDNFVRNMLAMLILFRFGGEDGSSKILIASMVFVLPAIPLSALGGEIADSHDKALVARRLKLAEIGVQMIAAAGFAFSSLSCSMSRCSGSAASRRCSARSNTASCPTICGARSSSPANALVEGATFAAIICGLIVGGFAAAEGRSAASVVAQLMVVALACYGSARFIPPTGVGAPGLKVHKNVFASTWRIIGEAARRRPPVGRGARHELVLDGRRRHAVARAGHHQVAHRRRASTSRSRSTSSSPLGVAAGSLGAAVLSHGRIELAPAPFLLLVIAALAIDLGLATDAMAPASREVPLGEFFTSPFGLRVAFELFLYSAAAGLFVVPIFAAIQAWAGEDRRARVVGAVNALNYIMMVAGSLATMALLQVVGL